MRLSLLSRSAPLWSLESHAARTLQLPQFDGDPLAIPHAGLSDEEQRRWKAAPEGLRRLIGRCLALNPRRRPTTAELLVDPFVATVEMLYSPSEATPPLP